MKKIQSFLIIIFLLMTTFGFVPSVTADGDWFIETVDSNSPTGAYNSIAVDSNNRPHISYISYYGSTYKLRYAKWTGSEWEKTDLYDAWYTYTSIALDEYDHPHISFQGADQNLKYIWWTGYYWYIETVDSEVGAGYHNSMALDSSGNTHISYTNYAGNLKYVKKTGSSWGSPIVIDSSGIAAETSIDVDNNNRPHISYHGQNHLKYATYTGSGWVIKDVDSSAESGGYNCIAVDSNNRPHISYNGINNHYLCYAKWTGSSWELSTVDSSALAGKYNSLVLFGPNDQPHISYYDSTNQDLKYAKRNETSWNIETIESTGAVGAYTSISVGSDERIHISYSTFNPKVLKHASCLIPNLPPDKPFNPSPNDGADDVDIDVVLKWDCSDPDGDILSYGIYFGLTEYNLIEQGWTTDKFYDPRNPANGHSDLSYNTDYYWQIVAFDYKHNFYTYGDVWSFKTKKNEPPSKPAISFEYKVRKTYYYRFISSDPENDLIAYHIHWGDVTEEQIVKDCISGMPIELGHEWPEKRSYIITARTKDSYGNYSPWAYLEVTVSRIRPSDIFLHRFFDRFPNAFPVIRQLLN